jgi:hypothetical protein
VRPGEVGRGRAMSEQCQVRSGKVWRSLARSAMSGEVKQVQARPGVVRRGWSRLVEVGRGLSRSGKVGLGRVRLGEVK